MLFPKEFVECIFCCFARPHAESALASRPACRSRNSWQPAHSLHKLQEIPFITCDSRVRRNKFSLLSERASSIKREKERRGRRRARVKIPTACFLRVGCIFTRRPPERVHFSVSLSPCTWARRKMQRANPAASLGRLLREIRPWANELNYKLKYLSCALNTLCSML